MKWIVVITTTLLLWGCKDHNKIVSSKNIDVDSLISESQKNFELVNKASKSSDSTISNKVDKTIQKIGNLETQVQQLKDENNELKIKLNDANDNGQPYRGLPIVSPH